MYQKQKITNSRGYIHIFASQGAGSICIAKGRGGHRCHEFSRARQERELNIRLELRRCPQTKLVRHHTRTRPRPQNGRRLLVEKRMAAGRRVLKPPETGGNTELCASEAATHPMRRRHRISQVKLGQRVQPGAKTSSSYMMEKGLSERYPSGDHRDNRQDHYCAQTRGIHVCAVIGHLKGIRCVYDSFLHPELSS